MNWYHDQLLHPGHNRMEESVLEYYTWPNARKEIREMIDKCEICQKNKSTNTGKDGKLPLRDPPENEPWEVISVNLMGPWTMEAYVEKENKDQNARRKIIKTLERFSIWALTIYDEASGWVELVNITNKIGSHICFLLDSEWFCRYPRPLKCIFDNDGEFDCGEFKEMLESYSVQAVPTTVKNLR